MNRNLAAVLWQYTSVDEFVMYRDAFRWKRYDPTYGTDPVLNNHFESMSIEQLAEDFGYEIDWQYNFKHVAIVRKIK